MNATPPNRSTTSEQHQEDIKKACSHTHISSRKRLALVNTLSSPRTPQFASAPEPNPPDSKRQDRNKLPRRTCGSEQGIVGEPKSWRRGGGNEADTFGQLSDLGDDSSLFDSATETGGGGRYGVEKSMARQRSPGHNSSAQQTTSSQTPILPSKSQRPPLANISTKMQSASPKSSQSSEDAFDQQKPPAQAEFGKASPLRNPLRKDPRANLFMPRQRTVGQKPPSTRDMSLQSMQAASDADRKEFQVPGQAPASSQYSALAAAQAYFEQPARSGFQPPPPTSSNGPQQSAQSTYRAPIPFAMPYNRPLPAVQPAPRPIFSSAEPATAFQSFLPSQPKQVVDLTKASADDDDSDFDPNEALRDRSDKFGAVDPYMYIDSTQANENIKNLLEGAFNDDDDQPKTRLRKRARKTIVEEEKKKISSLADRLAKIEASPEKTVAAAEPDVEPEEEEDGTVEGMTVKLLPHQVDGVSWMIDKEIGPRKRKGALPHGGILADDMGLGKTIQSVALILTNPRPGPDAKAEHKSQKMPGKEVGKGTLVVAPLALIRQWEAEIKSKVAKSHALKVLVHHGQNRTKRSEELKKYDVVITTYQILSSEHAGSNMAVDGGSRLGCFGVHWYRVVLDEAHSIKNRNAKSTLACCALQSWYRWCLTGTPMQNNLDELQSLIKFLQIKPYCELPAWKDQIIQPMKNGRGGLAMKRLNYFLKAFMKRRTKDILKQDGALNFGGKKDKEGEEKKEGMQIVKREVHTVECDFDDYEQRFYTSLQNRAENRLKDMMKDGHNDYIGALVLLLRLRQACNHPHLIEHGMKGDNAQRHAVGDAFNPAKITGSQTPRKGSDDMDDLAALMGGISVVSTSCDICQVELSAEEKRNDKLRCHDCQADLEVFKKGKNAARKDGSGRSKPNSTRSQARTKPRRPRNRRVVVDNDSDEEGEGEWIGDGPEEHVDLGKAGGTDDEDAEGGGETLGSIDTVSDDEDQDVAPRRAHRRPMIVNEESDEESPDGTSVDDSAAQNSEPDGSDRHDGPTSSNGPDHRPSTKIRQLLRILHRESPTHKTIVFSQFTSMLDLIEPHLRKQNLRYVRYDGSMRPDAREASLNALRNNFKTRVLLCSLKCGSLGLNLTAASRVVIVEPFWNPFVEEQAIDRVHRLNQTVDVKVFRLTVRDTVEERILELQERKRQLAAAAIEGGKAIGKLSMKDILSLFQRDAEHGDHDQSDRELWTKFGTDSKLLDGQNSDPSNVRKLFVGKQGVGRGEHDVYGRRW